MKMKWLETNNLKTMNLKMSLGVNCLEDMGKVNYKELVVDDLIKYHFPYRDFAFNFYSGYARMHGFAARKCRLFRNKYGEIVQQTFVCYREGKKKDMFGNDRTRKRRARKGTRSQCQAHFQVHVDKGDNRWYVKSVFDVHNHMLVNGNMIGLVPAHRRMHESDILQMNNLKKAGVRTPQVYGVFVGQMGGYENVNFSKQQMYNIEFSQKRKEAIKARGVLAILRGMKENDDDMFWKHTIDDNKELKNLFWSDGCSRRNYSIFGDVLAFDATYRQNKYRRPLVVFSSVNHHKQTIFFATALVSDEKVETYVWLLEQFLDAMGGKLQYLSSLMVIHQWRM
ncbi:putative protein FAR1-RELATED SEQUENCE 10 [Lotus japonicus]|uniref:putative protein FAR1-RELATED SEQUENCE 10 n=1 Tax=Lotus japonicus TaxID=34305 RepID=UPI00258A362C|nr:putative protein FAR1-RELATED SEQUENCE 10 [Lotus japonicus]XP_057427819.1 putative protein FAR1-RELATED SEQUENCE 10 [Lotus japonicus]